MAWNFVVQLGVLAVSLIVAYYLRPEAERAKAAGLNDFTFPRAEEGDAVALVYGTVRVESPSVVQFWVTGAQPIEPGGVIVGYTYSVEMRLMICRTNARIDDADADSATMRAFYIGDKRADISQPGSATGIADTFGNTVCRIDNEPSGGATEGKTEGYVIFYNGHWSALRNTHEDAAAISDPAEDGIPSTERSAYRGFVTARLFRWNVDSPSIAPCSPVIFNPCTIPGYKAQTGALGMGDCNPAAVLYDILTNQWGGVGNDATLVDVASFVDVAAVLADEQHGVSIIVTKQNEARAIIEEILRQIDGVLYQDMNAGAGGRYVLRLIREDYNPATLPVFDASNCSEEPELPSLLWSETFNQVNVVWTDPLGEYRPATATAQDHAGIAISGGRVRSVDLRFPGVSSASLANTLAHRELNFLSRPIYTIRMKVNRAAWNLKPGDPFKFTWAPWGVTIIFRAMEVDLGTLVDGSITITGVQDRFSISGTAFDPATPDSAIDAPPSPDPIQHRLITESPRFIQQAAWNAGTLNNADAQRGYYLALPEGSDSRYRVDAAIDGEPEEADAPARAFPATFTTGLSYARATDPYDVAVGIVVENLAGGTFQTATAAQIQVTGRNLIALFDDDGHHEVLAYEAAADLGGGQYQLQNVWRGLLDTVPRDWPAGTFGCVLPGTSGVSALGRRTFRHGVEVTTHTPAAAGSTWTPNADSPEDTLTARSRVLLPHRAQGLLVNGSLAPANLEEDGLLMDWRARAATTPTIKRGDASEETVQSGQTYVAVGYKGTTDDAQVELYNGVWATADDTILVPTGAVGHGDLEAGVDTFRAVLLPDGTSPTLSGWQVPTAPLRAHHWRNMLLNPRFAHNSGGLLGWTTVSGTPAVAATFMLGGAGFYVTGAANGGTTVIRQDVDVSGYLPSSMAVVLDFYARLLTDAVAGDDTVTVSLQALDAAVTVLSTTTYGPASPATWARQTLSIGLLDPAAHTLRVTITLTAVTGGGSDPTANVAVTEMALRLGQVSAELLANGSFEDGGGGGLTSWTQTVGTWQTPAATPYERTYYAQPDSAASAQLRQAVSIPTGYEHGVALLECARMNAAADDTGTVTLEALDSLGNVVASDTTGAEVITPTAVWQRRRLTIDPIPVTAVTLRVTLDAARVVISDLDACFDDFTLRCHKHLDPDAEIEVEWSASVAQPLPKTATAWKFAFPTVNPPDYALYDGSAVGRLGIEPLLMASGAEAFLGATAIHWDGNERTTTCYEARPGVSDRIENSPTGTAFCNFSSSTSFTVLAFWKVRPGASLVDGFGIAGRMSTGIGWELRLTDTDGFPMARVTGASAAASVTGTVTAADGSLHGAAMIYDATADTLTLVDAQGNASASTVATGELLGGLGKLRILFAGEVEAASLDGQVLRLYVWRSALSVADINEVLRYKAHDPSGLILGDARTGSIVCVTGEDASGNVQAETFGPGRTAIGYDVAADRWGLVTMPAINELASTAGGGAVDTGTVVASAASDPLGFRNAIRLQGSDTQGRTFASINFGVSSATVYVTFMARADAAHGMAVTLDHLGGGANDVEDVALTTTWAVYSIALTLASAGTVASVLFSPSNDGTTREIYLSPTLCISLVKPWPGTFPVGSPGATAPRLDVSTLTDQINHEGELAVEAAFVNADCAIGDLWNGTDDDDRRTVRWDATGDDITTDHFDGTGVINTTAQINSTTLVATTPATYRLRWCRAGIIHPTTALTIIRAEQGATTEVDIGRVSFWTPSAVPVDTLDLGHSDNAGVAAGLVYSARVSTREPKL